MWLKRVLLSLLSYNIDFVFKTVVNQSIQRVMIILTPQARQSHCTIHLHLDFTVLYFHSSFIH